MKTLSSEETYEMTYEDKVGAMILGLPIYELYVKMEAEVNVCIKDLEQRIKGEKFGKAKQELGAELKDFTDLKKQLAAISPVYELDKKVKAENRDRFVSAVKSYIDRNFGHNGGWEVIFSNDYTKLKKQLWEK